MVHSLDVLLSCECLEVLEAQHCFLTSISKDFSRKMTILRDLNLAQNKILDISALSNMTTLESLDLSGNCIHQSRLAVNSLKELPKLAFLNLRFVICMRIEWCSANSVCKE
jgi:Leucine-rich repeat (LRR) protein